MKELTGKMHRYVSLLNEKADLDEKNVTQEQYLQSKYPKPEKKQDRYVSPLMDRLRPVIILGSITIVSLVLIIIAFIIQHDNAGLAILFCFSGILAIGLGCKFLIVDAIDFFRFLPDDKMKEAENEKNHEYNASVYPKEIAEYEKFLPEREKEYEEYKQNIDKKLLGVEEKLSQFDGFLPKKYIEVADKILEILEDYRAESLTEAINVYENDCAQAAIYEEQQRARQAAEREAEIAERRAYAEEKRLAEEKEKLIREKRQAEREAKNVCSHCIYSGKCRKWGTPNCASYVPNGKKF